MKTNDGLLLFILFILRSFVLSFVRSFICSFVHSLICSFVHSFVCNMQLQYVAITAALASANTFRLDQLTHSDLIS